MPRQAATEIAVEELVHRAQIVSGCERAIIFYSQRNEYKQ
jgi:hypothetical protein